MVTSKYGSFRMQRLYLTCRIASLNVLWKFSIKSMEQLPANYCVFAFVCSVALKFRVAHNIWVLFLYFAMFIFRMSIYGVSRMVVTNFPQRTD